MRLLAHTGIVGLLLFALFLGAALLAWSRARLKRGDDVAWLAGACILPLIVWLIHGSVDWFWEMPALSGPALGFLGVAVALARAPDLADPASGPVKPSMPLGRRIPKPALVGVLLSA